MMSKKIAAFGLFATMALGTSVAVADMKIGVVDVREILENSPKAVAISEKLKNEFQSREDKIRSLSQELQNNADKFERNRAVMSEDEKKKSERDLMSGQRELARLQNEYREDSQLRQREEMQQFVELVKNATATIAKKNKYDLVLHSEIAPYAADNIDITKKVLEQINK